MKLRERGYEDMEKETEKERSDEDTVKQTEKERGDPGTQRKKRSPLCPQTTPLMGSILSLIFL